MTKSYRELISLPSFEERFEYLKLNGSVGEETFGSKRYLNQSFYRSKEWRDLRHRIIVRDEGCDLGVMDRPIFGRIYIHHINPLLPDHIAHSDRCVLDPENLICVSAMTHEAIHYGDISLIPQDYIPRTPGDTKLW